MVSVAVTITFSVMRSLILLNSGPRLFGPVFWPGIRARVTDLGFWDSSGFIGFDLSFDVAAYIATFSKRI